MASNYPNDYDSFKTWQDYVDIISASIINNIQDAVVAIEQELGKNPSGDYETVKERLDNIGSGSGGRKRFFIPGTDMHIIENVSWKHLNPNDCNIGWLRFPDSVWGRVGWVFQIPDWRTNENVRLRFLYTTSVNSGNARFTNLIFIRGVGERVVETDCANRDVDLTALLPASDPAYYLRRYDFGLIDVPDGSDFVLLVHTVRAGSWDTDTLAGDFYLLGVEILLETS